MTTCAHPLTRDDVRRVLHDLIQAEICRSRNVGTTDFQWPLADGELWLGDRGLALDSMERMQIASDIHALFDLYDTELGDRLLIAQTLEQAADLVHQYMPGSQLFFSSSGSTGNPNRSMHTLTNLMDEAASFAARTNPKRIICLVPTHHIYGFIWGILLPRLLGIERLITHEARAELHGKLKQGDLIVGVPTWWKYFATVARSIPVGVSGVTSTAPMDAALGQEVRRIGLSTLHEVYGASELAGIGIREHNHQTYELLERWQGISPCGQQLVDRDGQFSSELPDHLEFIGPRSFHVRGRKDHQVQVGGMNVSPSQIARRLNALEPVSHCQVRLMAPAEGERLKALLITQHDLIPAEREAIRHWCTQHLAPPERPHLTFTKHHHQNAIGKATDWPI